MEILYRKNHISKLLCLLLAVFLLPVFAGCNHTSSATPSTSPTESTTVPEPPATTEPHTLTVNCENADLGACIDDVIVGLVLDGQPLEHTVSWKISNDDQVTDMEPGSTLETNTLYQLHISYEMPISHALPIEENCGNGDVILNKELADGSFLIIVRYFYPEKT